MLLFLVKILTAYLLVFIVVPRLVKKLFVAFDKELIPSTSRKYTFATIIGALVLFTIIILGFSSGARNIGFSLTGHVLQIGLIGAAFMSVCLSVFLLFLPGSGKEQAQELGLQTPRDFIIHCTWYSFIWAAYREELFFRGLVQTQAIILLGSTWGLIVPLLYFSIVHAFNSVNLRIAVMWVISTLPGSLVFTLSYFFSGSLLAPIIAHGVNNALAGFVTYLAIYKPKWSKPVAVSIGLAGVVTIFYFRGILYNLLNETDWIFIDNMLNGLIMLAMLVLGTWLIHKYSENNKL